MLFSHSGSSAHLPDRRSAGIQTEGTVTVVTVGNPPNTHGLTNHLTGSLTSASLSSSLTLTHRNASTSTREINFPGSSLALAAQHLPPGYVIQHSAPTVTAGVTTINTTSGTAPYNMVPAITSSRNSIRYNGWTLRVIMVVQCEPQTPSPTQPQFVKERGDPKVNPA